MRRFCVALVFLASVPALGCSGSDDDKRTLREIHTDLSNELGCTPLEEFPEMSSECEELATEWFRCIEQDPTQCICEATDNDLNCEGSFKPNEGPALCIDEFSAFNELCD